MSTQRKIGVNPAGETKPWKASWLDKGADLLQSKAPVKQFDIYVVGFYCCKHNAAMQIEAHHYCRQVNGEFFQCVIFDGNTEDANLSGVEYIISERLFNTLPPEEQSYWHPHNDEVFSGELVAPGFPDATKKSMLKFLVNSCGETGPTWMTGNCIEEGKTLPLGKPELIWSFNRFDELNEGRKAACNQVFGIDKETSRRETANTVCEVHPRKGVDALEHAFAHADVRLPGVMDADVTGHADA